jgi:methylmalonyl-CoA/ethylmalonyl-CoA epimerase
MERLGAMLGGRVFQVGIVVSDLDAALRRHAGIFGDSRWRVYTFGPTGDHVYRGEPASFSVRLALNDASPQMELIQPLEGPSIHRDWLSERGEGFHHLGVIVPSMAEATAAMKTLGCPVIQSGTGFGVAGDGEFVYYDASTSLGMIVEAVVPAASGLGEPDALWP